MNRRTLEQIDALLDGRISRQDFAELQAVLKSDPVALKHYCRQAEIHGRLEWELGDPKNRHATVHVPKPPESRKNRRLAARWLRISTAAVLVLSLGMAWFAARNGNTPAAPPRAPAPASTAAQPPSPARATLGPAPADASVARLTNSQNARWLGTAPHDGAWLLPGPLELRSGTAEITFDSGARILLMGPARMELESAFLARLARGKATVSIPPQAAGFRLETPSNNFSDQDSSFAVAVAEDGASEIHVLRGLVEATPRARPELARLLSKNQSLSLTETAILPRARVLHSSASFPQSLPESLLSKPARFLHWPLDSLDSATTPESGPHSGAPFPAMLLAKPGTSASAAANLVEGKFGHALYFNGRGAFLSTNFPGIAGSAPRTVAFWVRIPPDATGFQGYSMVAWGASENARLGDKWQIAWNIGDEGGQPGAVRTEFGGGFVVGSTDLRDGRWHHVASVFLGGASGDVAARIRHYVDGRLESVTASKPQTIDTRLASPASLPTYFGRRLETLPKNTSFRGALDEIHLFPAALTPEQIDALYRTNTPPKWLMPGLPEKH